VSYTATEKSHKFFIRITRKSRKWNNTLQNKGKANLLQAWRLSKFLDNRHLKVARCSAPRTGRLYPPGNIPGTHFCYRLSRPQGHSTLQNNKDKKDRAPSCNCYSIFLSPCVKKSYLPGPTDANYQGIYATYILKRNFPLGIATSSHAWRPRQLSWAQVLLWTPSRQCGNSQRSQNIHPHKFLCSVLYRIVYTVRIYCQYNTASITAISILRSASSVQVQYSYILSATWIVDIMDHLIFV
jgi:hypothetical protein